MTRPRTRFAALPILALASLTGCSERLTASSREAELREDLTESPSLTPLKDGLWLTHVITHPYFPVTQGSVTELRSDTERVVREVQAGTRVIAGVECSILAEKEYKNGALEEISHNYFAQDIAGNLYYFGEDVDEYKDGAITGHSGAWLVGVNAAEPCLFMPADPRPGFKFKRENSPPAAEEWDMVEDTDGWIATPGGEFWHVLVIAERDKLNADWKERKYYAQGVGLVSENSTLNITAGAP